MNDELQASVIVRVKESSTAKPGSEPAVEVTATDRATKAAMIQVAVTAALQAYFATKQGLRQTPERLAAEDVND